MIRTDSDIRTEIVLALDAAVPDATIEDFDTAMIVEELVHLERDGGYDEDTFWAIVEKHART